MTFSFHEVNEITQISLSECTIGKQAEDFDESSFSLEEADEPLGKLENACKKDDNGETYSENGDLLPNHTYELNGNTYTTDEAGRIISVEATPKRSPENPRDLNAQQNVGEEDRRPGDQGGHIVSRDLGGDSGEGNLVAMDSKINQSDYKCMENDQKNALDDQKNVTSTTEISYKDDSKRPDKITTTVDIDGEKTVYKFDNDLDGSLMEDVPEKDKEIVQNSLDKTNGTLSSIKEEYDAEGNLVETTYTVTYSDETGNHRVKTSVYNE